MLTDIAIKTAKPQDRPSKIFDGGGLFVMINPNGSKLWRLKYRHQGKERLASFGAYPIVSLKDARLKRDEFKRRLASGEDPLSSNKGATFETAARDFVARQAQRLKPRYRRDTLRRLELNVFPDLGHLPIATIEAPDMLRVLRKIEARGAFEMAARVRATCSQIFRYGIAAGYNKRDIAADLVGALTPHKVRHHAALKVEELPELLRKIRESTEEEPVTRLALLFLANTAVRTAELIGAEWIEFDIKSAIWTVPSARMKMGKEHLVPLSRQVLRLLEELRTINGDSRYVFASPINQDKHISNNTILFALYRLGYRGRQTGHGFRSLFSTIANEERERGSHGFGAEVIERQLDHCERNAIKAAYNRAEHIQARGALMEWYSDFLQNAS